MMLTSLRFLFASTCLLLPAAHADDAHWSYHGDQGPAHWGEVGSPLCASGKTQSPIDIDRHQVQSKKLTPESLQVNYRQLPLRLLNNGHSIQADALGDESLTFKGEAYRLRQFHFHVPSEHLFNHRAYPMEMHLVNQTVDGRLLVLGVMIEEGKENAELAHLWRAMPSVEGQKAVLAGKDSPDLEKLLPGKTHHFYYTGSLTTPPCSEGVQWVLYERPIELSRQQIEQFRKLFKDNHRPALGLEGREIDED
jgi:carbonic anhydrase